MTPIHDDTLNPFSPNVYMGAPVSKKFHDRWLSKDHVGSAKPFGRVSIRRGYMKHGYHDGWPGDNGPLTTRGSTPRTPSHLLGLNTFPQWYPDWTPTTDWIELPAVSEIDINQAFSYAGGAGGDGSGGAGGSNGIAVATVTADNVAWAEVAGQFGAYHAKQRGWLWPWRGYVPASRPGSAVPKNQWYDQLPNAQILIEQGYGSDTAIKTFTGLIDTIGPGSIRPDRITLSSRDFGGALVDVNPFGWNKDLRLKDPCYFIPPDYSNLKALKKSKTHNWVIVEDATDIVRCILRWVGFKEWEIDMADVGLKTAFLVDRSSTWMDVINQVASQLGYVFFIAEPSPDDLSIGVPIFRRQSVLYHTSPQPKVLDSGMLTDVQPQHDNSNDRHIIRVRGRPATRKEGGRPIIGGNQNEDGQVMLTFQYWPPWMPKMAGIIKQLTYYNQGSNGVLGFGSIRECRVACVLIAVQIALTRDTATVQFPANPAFGLDSMGFINDPEVSGIVSRLYITSRRATMRLGGDGSSGSSGAKSTGELLWSHELQGSLVDNPEWEKVINDFQLAIAGENVPSSGGHGQWD